MKRSLWLLCAVLMLVAVSTSQRALAHAVLLGTEPPADSVLEESPAGLVLRFNEPVQPVVLRLLDADGQIVADEADARALDHRVELPLTGALPQGGYIVSWRVISADSHPVGGSLRFAIGAFPDHWQGDGFHEFEQSDARFWTLASAAARAIFLTALLAAAGGAWFVAMIAREQVTIAERGDRFIPRLALAGAAAALAGIGMHGGLLLAAPPLDLLSPSPWAAGLATPIGRTFLASATLLVLLAAAIRALPGKFSAFAALFAVLPLALAGHVATAEPRWLTGPSIAVHLVVAGFWFGSLPPLLFAVRSLPGPEAARILERFSAWAVWAVTLLVAAGGTIAVVQLRSVSALWQTTYGLVLVGKVVLVAGLLAIAAYNKMALTEALAAGRENAAKRLSRSIGLEIVLIGAVVALTATLSFNTPPRSLSVMGEHRHHHAHHHDHDHHDHDAQGSQPATEMKATVRGTTATLSLSPGRAGTNRLRVQLEDSEGKSVEPLEVGARFSSPELGIEPVIRRLERRDDHFEVETSDLALPGAWQIRIDVLVSDFDKPIFRFEVNIRQ